MTTLWWVRHGPTHEKTIVGWRDVPADLSDTAAIARLSAWLPAKAPLVSSDLSRAVATADALALPTRPRLAHNPALREFNFGLWDGLASGEISARDPDLVRAFWDTPGDIAPPEGESWNAVERRVSAAVDTLAAGREHLIAVAHLGVIMTQIGRALGPAEALSQQLAPLSVTKLTFGPGGWQAETINHCP